MKFKKRTLAATLAASTALGACGPAWADGGGVAAGLLGGMVIGGAIRGNREQQNRQAYQSGYNAAPPQTVVVQQPPASSGGSSVEQRIRELNNMHKKGMISDSEYKARRQQILDSL
jgi:hypothetical protein